MLKKSISLLLLLCFLFSRSAFASEPDGAVQRIRGVVSELREEQRKSEELIQSLETSSEQIATELKESLASQKRQAEMLENYGNLIDDQATYYRSLNKKLTFWRATSITLSVSLLATVGTVLAITQPWK